jgi:hypothetical protein
MEYDFRNPDGIGIVRPPPGQVAGAGGEPVELGGNQGFDFACFQGANLGLRAGLVNGANIFSRAEARSPQRRNLHPFHSARSAALREKIPVLIHRLTIALWRGLVTEDSVLPWGRT